VLLVNPGLASSPTFNAINSNDYPLYYNNYDVSARMQQDNGGTWKLVPNSLGDLTKREFRFAHYEDFPFDLNTAPPVDLGAGPPTQYPNNSSAYLVPFFPTGPRFGDDVLLTNVLSFDVQVFDPGAPVDATSTVALTPPDPGYTTPATVTAKGGYVDMGWGDSTTVASFSQAQSRPVSGGMTLMPNLLTIMDTTTDPPTSTGTSLSYTYDTWSMHYENNGINDDGDMTIDEGTNGLDDDANGIVDDANEMETQSPFAAQLRGVRITIRVYEPSSQQVRQMTVVGDFLPD
jgi:hypothetical protein